MLISDYSRFQLVNSLMGKLKDKYAVTGASYTDLRRKYYILFYQRFAIGSALSSYISGIYVDRSFVGQKRADMPFTPVPDEYKKKVMSVLRSYVFAPNAFVSDASLYPYLQMQRRGYNFNGKTEDPKPEEDVLGLQSTVLSGIMNSISLSRAGRTTLYGNSWSPAVIVNELTSMVFDEDLKGDVNLFRQNLQKTYVNMLIGMMKDPKYDNASVSSAYESLKQIRTKIDKLNQANEQTNAHRGNLKFMIDKALVIR